MRLKHVAGKDADNLTTFVGHDVDREVDGDQRCACVYVLPKRVALHAAAFHQRVNPGAETLV